MTLARSSGKCALDHAAQDQRAVMGFVMRRIDEGDGLDGCAACELGDGFRRGILLQLPPVACDELVPSCGVVSEPAPQFMAGRQVLEPRIELEIRLPDTARPEPLHEHPITVVR